METTIKSRKFKGKLFLVVSVHRTKRVADRMANALRARNQLARVRKKEGKWVVYSKAR